MSDIKIMNGENPSFSVSMTDAQVRYCTTAVASHDALVEQNKALSDRNDKLTLSLDDMTMYCADADMKNDELASRNTELERALGKQKIALDGAMSQLSRPCNSINSLSFIGFVGVVEKETNDLLEQSK